MPENIDQHELVIKLKELAVELGRVPTSREAKSAGITSHRVYALFGSYNGALEAAGLKEPARRITGAIFNVDVNAHVEEYVPRIEEPLVPGGPNPTMAIISDIHWPFHAQAVVDKFYRYVEREQPEVVIIDGDAWDMYSHTKFPRSHNIFTPKEEELLARKLNVEFWQEVRRLSPNSKCYQLLGNHDARPLKRTLETYPQVEHWVAKIMGELFHFSDVTTVLDPREELFFGNIMVHHGYKSKLGDHRDFALYNAIVGHTHKPGIVYRKIRGQSLWEMNCGYAGDPEAKGLTYTPQKITNWVQSFGAVDEDGPRIILL